MDLLTQDCTIWRYPIITIKLANALSIISIISYYSLIWEEYKGNTFKGYLIKCFGEKLYKPGTNRVQLTNKD